MNEPTAQAAGSPRHDHHAWREQFVSRINRLRGVLRNKWWVPVLAIAVGIAVQMAVVRFEKPMFTSIGRMIVSIKLAIPEGSVYTEELSNFLGTQAALMQSSVVHNRVTPRIMSARATEAAPPVNLRVSVLPKTTIFVLLGSGHDREYTQAYVQACMEEYVNLKKEMRQKTSDTTVAGLTEEVLRLGKDLQKGEESLAAFQGSNSVLLLTEQGNSTGNYLTVLNQRRAALKTEKDVMEALSLDENLNRMQLGGDALPAVDSSAANQTPEKGSGAGHGDTDYLRARQMLLLLKAEQQELGQFLKPKHPKMIALKEDLARRERLLGILRQQGTEIVENRKKLLTLQIKSLLEEIKEWESKAMEASQKMAEFERLQASTKRTQSLYDRLLGTLQTLDVNKEINQESVSIMESACPAFLDMPSLPKRLLIGAGLGLALSLLLLLFLDRLDDRLNSFTELRSLFAEEVLAQVPRERSPVRGQPIALITPEDVRHSFVEAYRNLRSSLLYMAAANPQAKSLLVTSSVPNEGKSLTAANLAITLANGGARVLLVDADLRKGMLTHRFGLSATTGLSEVLANGANWRDAVLSTVTPNLWLLPRGAATHRSSELFVSEATRHFIRDACSQYDQVVIDTAPVMAADDVTSLAPQTDSTVFVVRAEYTSGRVARASLGLLYQRNVNVIGLIFNAIRPGTLDYYYYKYSDYYTRHAGGSAAAGSARTAPAGGDEGAPPA